MPTRLRTRSDIEYGYRIRRTTGAVTTRERYSNLESTEDVVQEGDNHPFNRSARACFGGQINGFDNTYEFKNYLSSFHSTNVNAYRHAPTLPSLNTGLLATEVASRTNPSRSSVDSIVSLVELRELPSMLRESWGLANRKLLDKVPSRVWRNLSRAAKLHLIIQFGIAPMMSDFEKLLEFQRFVDQRVKELEKLRTRGLRRTIELQKDTAMWENEYSITESTQLSLSIKVRKRTMRTVRAHTRWYTHGPLVKMSDQELRSKAKDIVIGNRFDPVTMWNLLPWSWLSDYFFNIGDYIESQRNSCGARMINPRLIVQTTTETTHNDHSRSASGGRHVGISRYYCNYVTKERYSVTKSIEARQLFLTDKQTSILGSLAVLKGRKAR